MAFRFFRRIRIAPGISLNLSKSGGSLSLGPRGAKLTVGPRGIRKTLGLPGTSLYYTEHDAWQKGNRSSTRSSRIADRTTPEPVPIEQRLTLGFFKRLLTPDDEAAFVDGLKAFVEGDETKALDLFNRALHIADAAFMAGFIALKHERFSDAVRAFQEAERRHAAIGHGFSRYGVALALSMPITDQVTAHIEPSRQGLLLGQVEALQEQKNYQEALETLLELRRIGPDDIAVKVSFAEVVMEAFSNNHDLCHEIVQMAADLTNETSLHAALMLYKARALRTLGLASGARDTLTAALRKKKDRSATLLRALRYERALVYEDLGQCARARADFEKIYAQAPDYPGIAAKLGLSNERGRGKNA